MLEAPYRSKRNKRGESKGEARGGATARGTIEKSASVGVIAWKDVTGDDPIAYFSSRGS